MFHNFQHGVTFKTQDTLVPKWVGCLDRSRVILEHTSDSVKRTQKEDHRRETPSAPHREPGTLLLLEYGVVVVVVVVSVVIDPLVAAAGAAAWLYPTPCFSGCGYSSGSSRP